MGKVRILVVDDSLTVRRYLCALLSADPDIEVIGEAGDGKQAIELCQERRPDVITMDMMMPVMTGLSATEYIMAARRVVIVILDIPENTRIDGELIGGRQLKDLNRARAFLCDIAARHQKYCDVFDSVENAVHHIVVTHPNHHTQR